MSISSKEAKRDRKRRREANMRAYKLAAKEVPIEPSLRDIDVTQLNSMLTKTDNVKDIPLGLLRVHPVHGDRNPYVDTPEGARRRARCQSHIRASNGWNNAACEVLTGCEGGDGFIYIINGIGRLYMADQLSGGLVQVLPVRVLQKLSNPEVRKVFEIMGTQITKISPWDLWRANESARGETGQEVRDILAVKETFGNNWPHIKLPVMRFGNAHGKLQAAVALVNNTSLGTNAKLVNIMTSAVIALLASNPRLEAARLRHVLGDGKVDAPINENLPGWLFDRAQARANKLGYLKPHARTTSWLVAAIIAEELYNHNFRGAKLDTDALATVRCDYADAFSSAPPPPKRTKFAPVAKAA